MCHVLTPGYGPKLRLISGCYSRESSTDESEKGMEDDEMSSQCPACNTDFEDDAELQEHIKMTHPEDMMECKLCGDVVLKSFFSDHVKRSHGFDLEHGKKGGIQSLCSVELDEVDTQPPIDIDFKGVSCQFCKQSYSTKLNLKKHMYNVHRMQRVKCNVCDKEVNKKSLERHMRSVHSARISSKRERKSVPDDQKVPCHLCPKKCVNIASLQSHVKNIHEAEQFKCSQCDFQSTKRGLERHMNKEHNSQVYQCTRCNKVLKSKSTLKEHMWIHTEDRRFICDVCGMRFKRTSNYHGHLKSHQEKKFQCQLCGNFFLRKRYLAVHQQTIHDFYGKGVPPQEKGYQCEVCGVKLKWKNNLMAHMRIHTGEKPYKCKVCGDDFTCHGSLRTHISKHGLYNF